jgi:uncharacterized protein
MKLHLTTAENKNLITAYQLGQVEINKVGYDRSLILTATQIIIDWLTGDFSSLTETAFTPLLAIKPEVVILGTGEKHQFLHPNIYQALTTQGIPLECMTTAAACRTYNILMSEGRHVVAALILRG